jgi:hypothetical protein
VTQLQLRAMREPVVRPAHEPYRMESAVAPSKLLSIAAALPHVLHAVPRLRPVVRRYRGTLTPKLGRYLRYGRQIARATHFARGLGLHQGRPGRILDLGSGPSYFPYVCARMGHDILALDVDSTPLYNDMTAALQVPRVVHAIRAHEPLPDLDGPFDLITALLICFNGHKDADVPLWGVEEWAWFVDQMRPLAGPAGCRLLLRFNRERSGVAIPDELRAWFVAQGGQCAPGGIQADLHLPPAPPRSPPSSSRSAAAVLRR